MNSPTTDNSEHFDSLLQTALQKTHTALQRGAIDVALQWNDIALDLSQPKVSDNAPQAGQPDDSRKFDEWLAWWESVDEMIFLVIGLAYSFIAEVAASHLPPARILNWSLFIIFLVFSIVCLKTIRIFFTKRKL